MGIKREEVEGIRIVDRRARGRSMHSEEEDETHGDTYGPYLYAPAWVAPSSSAPCGSQWSCLQTILGCSAGQRKRSCSDR